MEHDELPALFTDPIQSVEWRTYSVDAVTYIGSLTFSDSRQMMVLCLTTLSEPPIVVPIDNQEIESQCTNQGFDSGSLPSILKAFLKKLETRTNDFKIVKQDEFLKFDLTISDKIVIKIQLKVYPVDQQVSSDIFRAISRSLVYDMNLFQMVIEELQTVIRHKDQAIGFLKDNMVDLGFESLITKWAPPNSFNHDIITKFDLNKWEDDWASQSIPANAFNCEVNSISSTLDLLSRKKNNVIASGQEPMKRKRAPSMSTSDSNSFDSFIQLEDTQPLLTKDQAGVIKIQDVIPAMASSIVHLSSIPQEPSTLEGQRHPVTLATVEETSLPGSRMLSPVDGDEIQIPNENAQSYVESSGKSPSKKRRKFGKVRTD